MNTPMRRRLSPMTLLLGAAVLVIIGLAAALIAVTTASHGGRATATPTATSPVTATPAAVTVTGSVTMEHYDDPDSDFRSANWHKVGELNCEGDGGYDDMTEGAVVTVYDSTGSVVGVGALRAGLATGSLCAWSFEVTGVPDAQFYQVEVSHRGKVAVPRTEASTVSLSLG